MDGYGVITVTKGDTGKIIVSFPYNPQLVQKVKTIEGRKPRWNCIRDIEPHVQKQKFFQCIIPMASHEAFLRGKWHPTERHWSFPNTDGTLEKILKVFKGEEIRINPALQANLSAPKGTVPDLRTEQSGVPSLVIASPDKIGTKQSQSLEKSFLDLELL